MHHIDNTAKHGFWQPLCVILLAIFTTEALYAQRESKLLADDGDFLDQFGFAVSVSGDYAIIGAHGDDPHGSAYIFVRDGADWLQQAKVTANDDLNNQNFGRSVSLSGDYAIVGDPYHDDGTGELVGAAFIFVRNKSEWIQQAKLTASDGFCDQEFGGAVAISGEYAIVGASRDTTNGDNAGAAYVFKRSGSAWTRQAKLLGEEERDDFGESVAISGDYAIVSAPDHGPQGSAYIFKGPGWSQQAELTNPDESGKFGFAVSISGDYAIVAGSYVDAGVSNRAAYIFTRSPDGSGWIFQDRLTASDGERLDGFGEAVAISEDFALVGAPSDDDNGDNSGSAYIFRRDGSDWIEAGKLTASDGTTGDSFGFSVATSGGDFLVGAYRDNDLTGSAYMYSYSVWANPTSGGFSDGANWEDQVVPGEDFLALFDTDGTYSVTFSEDVQTRALEIGDNLVIFDLVPSHTYILGDDGPVTALQIGTESTDTFDSILEITSGTVRSWGSVHIGADGTRGRLIVGSEGFLWIDNPFDLLAELWIGADECEGEVECGQMILGGGGLVHSLNGSSVGVAGGKGTVFVSGNGSLWADSAICTIGRSGEGTLTVEQEGVFNGNSVFIGDDAQGTVTVSGTASLFSHRDQMIIANFNTGTFEVTDGALAESHGQVTIGLVSGASGEALITGDGSTWITHDLFVIGLLGNAGLTVSDGAAVFSNDVILGQEIGSFGSAQIDGSTSRWSITGILQIGCGDDAGIGILQLLNGGVLEVFQSACIGPTGSLDISGGNLIIGLVPLPPAASSFPSRQELQAGGTTGESSLHTARGADISGAESFGSGPIAYIDTLFLAENGELLADSVFFEEGGYLGGSGTFSFEVINSGGINPGDGLGIAGMFTVSANYTQLASGTLFIELGGAIAGDEYDVLAVTGDAVLGGTLNLSLINAFQPQVGQTLEVLTASSVSGAFDQIVTTSEFDVDVAYNATNVTVTITMVTGVEETQNGDVLPGEFALYQNYPNPFNPSTEIRFALPQASQVRIEVFNVTGQKVATLLKERKPAGSHTVRFEADGLTSGVYFYALRAGNFRETRKMLLTR